MKPISWILAAIVMALLVGYVIYLDRDVPVPEPNGAESVATFAGGCFWCLEAVYEQVPGVSSVTAGHVGHREAVRVIYNPEIVSYRELLDRFWRNIDPTDGGGQFVDRGGAYTTAIFFHTTTQQAAAAASRAALAASGRFADPIVTEILPAARFHPAGISQQDFYRRCPIRYTVYRRFSGRDEFFRRTWLPGPESPVISSRTSR